MTDQFITREDMRNLRKGFRNGLLMVGPFWMFVVYAYIKWGRVIARFLGWA